MMKVDLQGNLLNRTATLEARRYVVDSGVSGTSGWRVWSDGYVEQWGVVAAVNGAVTVNLHKPFSDINYNIETTMLCSNATTFYSEVVNGKTTTYFTVYQNVGATYGIYIFWFASGY